MSDTYSLVKIIHVSTVSFTGIYFFIRGLSQLNHRRWFKKKWARKISQYNDVALLFSGISMAAMIKQYPFANSWLTAKFLMLLVYIICGMLAFYWLKKQEHKTMAWIAALLVYAYIVGVAMNKNPAWLEPVFNTLF
ncbi:hypothetical protein MNBD_GAMMA25-1926 [hydrothermal vent metagenome]|uniref:Uncharacterized protein n=1 Tax=hydrothermal vent metagenome TaxID=652676 RepID=A0A3B1AKS4_9ZZZZ